MIPLTTKLLDGINMLWLGTETAESTGRHLESFFVLDPPQVLSLKVDPALEFREIEQTEFSILL